MDNQMFCYQCEQAAGGKGCTKMGVCGKDPQVAALQDLLIYQLKGMGFWGQKLINDNKTIPDKAKKFMMDGLFSTLTNVNFDRSRFVSFINEAQSIKEELREMANAGNDIPEPALYTAPRAVESMLNDAGMAGIMADENLNEDIRSLRSLMVIGLKGMAAYAYHALILGKTDDTVNNFLFEGLAATIDDTLSVDDLVQLNMKLGKVNFRCMEILDDANTSTYGHPVPTEVLITKKKGPFIIISGHDLKDLKDLLEQTEGKGINIYTHGEMLPSHAYPELKKHKHLVGNFGGAWYEQQKEFDQIPGCILMTTNCLQKPKDSYKDRLFTTGIVGFDGINHVEETDGQKDFTPVINKALELGGWQEDEEEKKITVGFGHNTVLGAADKVIAAIKGGNIKHIFLIGGCDGAKPGRNYFTEFAQKTPKDTLILTLACGKYRFNKLNLGTIGDFPRVLDVGQCNDAYSAVKIALALADAFNCSVNELPLSLILSWYEQKAVSILLTLLSLGVKNIYIGPSLPAFVSPNVLNVLVDNFNITPISTPDEDMKAILNG